MDKDTYKWILSELVSFGGPHKRKQCINIPTFPSIFYYHFFALGAAGVSRIEAGVAPHSHQI